MDYRVASDLWCIIFAKWYCDIGKESKPRAYLIFFFPSTNSLFKEEQADFATSCILLFKEDTIKLCDNRQVLFDNKTRNPKKKDDLSRELMSLVNLVFKKNDGQPYTNNFFKEFKPYTNGFFIEFKSLEGNFLVGDSMPEINELKEATPRSYYTRSSLVYLM
ncbi:hypothetical protein K7X08_004233 [Anisodus acutangulus]|uniref:AIG1-type G domain-containing protein n=1 Tax=Anisodus acutangulus TaxID=402998 RepID=A0A9Q1RK45_9SOLA|nr:hypothetical protein K7X08_004233 [Anisodus acutangulus]